MSRFQEISDTIYVGYNENDLKNYAVSASKDASCKNRTVYDKINTEFNPEVVPHLTIGDKISHIQPFYGPNGLSLQLTENGNVYLQQYTDSELKTLWTACNSNFFDLSSGYSCDSNGVFLTKTKEYIVDPVCELDTKGNLICSGKISNQNVKYMTFTNKQQDQSYTSLNLIINGDYTLDNSYFTVSTGKNMIGNLTILDSNNNIINSTIEQDDVLDISKNLQSIFDKSKECDNAYGATNLIGQHNKHLAVQQVIKDANIAYNIQYLNGINLGVGILATMGYIYYLYKKK
jgi:hypothetical protein